MYFCEAAETCHHLFVHSYSPKEESENDDEGEDSHSDDDDDDDDDDSDEDEDEKRAVSPPSQPDSPIYRVLSDFQGEQEGDLSVQVELPVLLVSASFNISMISYMNQITSVNQTLFV